MAVLYTDDFNRANGAAGANWIGVVGDEFTIVSNQLIRNLSGGGSDFFRWVPAVPSSDHYTEAKVVSFPGGAYLALNVRGSGPMTAPTLYMAFYDPGVTCWTIGKMSAGSYSGILSSAGGVAAPAAGTVLRLEVQGTALRLYAATVLVLSTTDGSITTGTQAGVNANAISGIGFDNFTVGDFAPTGPTFVTGRMWDDENGTDTVGPIAAYAYTELEWNLKAQAPATAGQIYQFRVQAGAVPFDTYTLTPQLTVASPVAWTQTPTDVAGISDTATPVLTTAGALTQNPTDVAGITDTATPDLVSPGGGVTYTELLDARQTLTLPSGNFVSGSFTTAASKVLLAVQRMDNQAPGDTTALLEADVPVPTTAGLTWLKVGAAFNTGRHWTTHIFYWVADCPSIATRTFTQSGSGTWLTEMAAIDLSIYELTGAAAAAAQTKTEATATSTEDSAHRDPGAQSLTLPTAPATTSVVFATYAGDCDNPALTVTQGAGWTEVSEIPGSPLTSQVQTRTGSTSTAVDWADLSSAANVWDYSLFAWEVIVPGAGPVDHAFTVTDAAGITDFEIHANFPVPTSTANRKILDQFSNVYLLRSMAFWGVGQNASNVEITSALNGLSGRSFNAVTASACGSTPNGTSGWVKYKNIAGQDYFTGSPYASSLGAAWSTIDWLMAEASRLQMTVLFSLFVSWGTTGSNGDIVAAGTTNMYNFGVAVANRYAAYRNIVWHVMGDVDWDATSPLGVAIDAYYHGLRDAEGSTHRLITAEHYSPRSCYAQFIAQEGTSPAGYQWFRVSSDAVYDYGSASVEQFEAIYADANAPTYPVWDCEPPYVHAGWYAGNEPQQVRERNYGTFIPNGVGINYGDEYFWPTGKQGLFGGTHTDWLTQIDAVTTVQAGYAWSLLDTYVKDLTWAPGTFVTTGLNSGDDKAAVGASNTALLAYFPSTRATVVVDTTVIVGTGNVRLRWYDPTAGTYATITASEAQTASRTVTYPSAHGDGTSDYVLVVDGAGGAGLTQSATDPAGIVDAVTVVCAHVVAPTGDVAALVDTATPALNVLATHTDLAAIVDSTTIVCAHVVAITDPAALDDAAAVVCAHIVAVTDAAAIADSIATAYSYTYTDTAAIADAATPAAAFKPSYTDLAAIADAATYVAVFSYSFTDPAAIDDLATPLKSSAGAQTFTTVAGIVDSVVTYIDRQYATDVAGIVDSAAPVLGVGAVDHVRPQTDVAGIVDATTLTWARGITPTDPAGIVDTASLVCAHVVTATDAAAIDDSAIATCAHINSATDVAGLVDNAAIVCAHMVLVTDPIEAVDNAPPQLTSAGAMERTDVAGIDDSVRLYLDHVYSTDVAGIADSVAVVCAHVVAVTDVIAGVDVAGVAVGFVIGRTDAIAAADLATLLKATASGQTPLSVAAIVDSFLTTQQAIRTHTDVAGIDDLAVVSAAQRLTFTDQIGAKDQATPDRLVILNQALAIFFGALAVQAVYVGTTRVWPSGT